MADTFSSAVRRLLTPVWILLAALTIAGTAAAADAPASSAEDNERHGFGLRIDRERMVTRVSIELESFATFDHAAGPGSGLHDHVMFEEMSAKVRRGAERVTRRAVKNYLLETIKLDKGIDSVRKGVRGPRTGSRKMRFNFGFHSALPQVGVTKKVGQGSLRFQVGAEGNFGVRFRNKRFERADVSAAFDGDDTVTIRAHLGF
jgi:hypothetical protein